MRVYRSLLHLFPVAFRNEYESEMTSDFARKLRDAGSLLARLLLWLETLSDLILTAIAAHFELLVQDLRYCVRTLGRAKGFTMTAILVAALGVGATTAAFSVMNHVLLRPLPFRNADRLVRVWEDLSPTGYRSLEPSPANYRDWKRMNTVFEDISACRSLSVNLVGSGAPQRLDGASVNANLFPLLGVAPMLGRSFQEADDRDGAPGTAMLSYALWRSVFAGDPNVLGRKVLLDGAPFTVIGVMPGSFLFPRREVQIWTAMRFSNTDFEDRNNNYLWVVARLRSSMTIGQAQAAMHTVAARLREQYPKENQHVDVAVVPLRDVPQSARTTLFALLGAALCVLLISCLNLANLLLARALVRRKELAVRTALGAGRERLIRQLLTESLLLATIGGALGAMIAVFSAPLLGHLIPDYLPIADTPAMDYRVFLFALVGTLSTGLGFGILPALRACRDNDTAALQEGDRQGVGGRKERLRGLLVIAEVAGSVVLLITSGLFIRALWRIQSTDPGFRASGVLTLQTSLTNPQYDSTARRVQFYNRVLAGIQSLPGVQSAAYTSFLPVVVQGGVWEVSVDGKPGSETGQRASLRFITPGFFGTMGIPQYSGRDVSEADTDKSLYVAVVSRSFAHRFWPNQNPIGRHFEFAFATRTIVGVVGDVRVRGLERISEPQVYVPYKQVPDGFLVWYAPKDLAIRTSVDPTQLIAPVRRVIAEVDPQQPVSDVQTMTDVLDFDTSPRRMQVNMLGAFAAVAFLLAGIGIHGLLAFAVSSRRQEIGVRMALGANGSTILGMIFRQGLSLSAAGIAIGVLLAYGVGKTLESVLAGVQPGDAVTFGAGIVLALLMSIAGSILPAMAAVRVDPMSTLR